MAVLFSMFDLNDNHGVRILAGGSSPPKAPWAVEPSVGLPGTDGGEFAKWYNGRADKSSFNEKYPVYIVAAQGGGIYAADHVASFLASLHLACPRFTQHLFAISGVSGGSVGASVFATYAKAIAKNEPVVACDFLKSFPDPVDKAGKAINNDTIYEALAYDFLSPLLGYALFPDFLQRFLPFPVPAFDRAAALEKALEMDWEWAAHRARSSECESTLCGDFLGHWNPDGTSPALLLNTTEVGSGRRRVIAPFKFNGALDMRFFPLWDDTYEMSSDDEGQDNSASRMVKNLPKGLRIRLSTAAILSARFPWLTPAGSFDDYKFIKPTTDKSDVSTHPSEKDGMAVPRPMPGSEVLPEFKKKKILLADGGYFENSGVATAMELIKEIQNSRLAREGKVDVKMIVLTSGTFEDATSFGLSEAFAPVLAMLNARSARSHITVASATLELAKSQLGGSVSPPGTDARNSRVRIIKLRDIGYQLPLGWRLSQLTQDLIDSQSGDPSNCHLDKNDERAKDPKTGRNYQEDTADCVVRYVIGELKGTILGVPEIAAK